MGGSWFAYVIVFFGCFVFLLLIAGTTAFLYLVARRRGELKPHNVTVVGLSKPEASPPDPSPADSSSAEEASDDG